MQSLFKYLQKKNKNVGKDKTNGEIDINNYN